METFFDWFGKLEGSASATWLVLGKGPSIDNLSKFDVSSMRLISLNHAVRERKVLVAHVIDADVLADAGDAVLSNAEYLLMPWIPHEKQKPGALDLAELAKTQRVVGEMERRGKLLWYHLGTSDRRNGESPVIKVKGFSAEAVVALLAKAGARTVRTLGVDGGSAYGATFKDLDGKTLLANGRPSFDIQFQGIAKTIRTTGIDFSPLDVQSPVRVFVGATEAQTLAVKILEYSIRKHASISVEVIPLWKSSIAIPVPKDPANKPRTPFSFQRFMIPELCGFRGRAIYVDSDMQVFRDIRGLWTLPFGDSDVFAAAEIVKSVRRPQFSVLLIDCEASKWSVADIVRKLDEGVWSYDKLMKEFAIARNVKPAIDPSWNSLERYDPQSTCLLHYTDMNRQPWLSRRNPLAYLWFRDLIEAVDDGFVTLDEVRDHVARGWIRPTALYQVEHRIDDPLLLPGRARRLDRDFVPPYEGGKRESASPWSMPRALLRAHWRRLYERSPLPKLGRSISKRLIGPK